MTGAIGASKRVRRGESGGGGYAGEDLALAAAFLLASRSILQAKFTSESFLSLELVEH